MPFKALVAFGAVVGFGFSILLVPAWGAEIVPSVRTAVQEDSAAASAPLTLDESYTRTLTGSPVLAAFSKEIQAGKAEALQAGLRPNPELSVEVENVAGSGDYSGFDSAETTVRLSQLVELGGKRRLRRQAGDLERTVADRDFEAARAAALAETAGRFAALLAAQERLALAGQQLRLAEQVLRTGEERIEAGKAPAVERLRLQALVAEARLAQDQARQQRATARQALAAAWGGETADFDRAAGEFEHLPALPDWLEVSGWIAQTPAVAGQAARIEQSRQKVKLEDALGIPDLTVSLGAKDIRETNDRALVAEFSVPLQFFDRNQGARSAARARHAKAGEEHRAALLQARTDLVEAWGRMTAARGTARVLREEILPVEQQSFEAISYGYRAGKFGLLEILGVQRTLFEARGRYIDALEACHQAVAEIEGLLGRKISNSAAIAGIDTERGES
ncbi:MAG: TolC family protein [Desulfuromonas sp.]|uniref:TolC family protein n=1 Tax=Desulfuromonas sp. TaxID=892 RepID=UPI000CC6A052|nr:TolC family protein [Desulfuromonas sp.]PLX82325.1 MAG: TolC family protein [Desulfuromonas sp.]